jgi:broad specificity phosphatase PhoE
MFPQRPHASDRAIVKRLFLCRHGETDANASGKMQGSGIDLDLNDKVSGFDKGILQGEALRDQLQGEEVDLIVCSKLKVI